MDSQLTEAQAQALGRAISCYLEKVDDPDEQFLIREVINKFNLRGNLSDYARQLL